MAPRATQPTGCIPTWATATAATTRPTRSTPATSASCARLSSSRPKSRSRWKPRRSSMNGVMFLTTSYNHVYAHRRGDRQGVLALQAQDGAGHHLLLRSEQPRRGDAIGDVLYMGTLDAKLVALDAKTGKLLWEARDRRSREGLLRDDGAGRGGRQGPDRHQRRRVRHPRLREGLRRQSGKLLWTFYTIPEKGHEGVWAINDAHRPQHAARHRQGEADCWREQGGGFYQTLGGGVWMTPAVDRKTKTALLRGGQPLARPVRRHPPRRQPLHRLDRRDRPGYRHLQGPLPVRRSRRVGSGRGQPRHPDRSARTRMARPFRSRSTAARPATSTCTTATTCR